MSHLSLLQKLGTFRSTSSLPFVLWPHRLSRASLLSLHQCDRLHDRSRTCLINGFRRARQARHTPCLCRHQNPAVVCQRVYHSHVTHQLHPNCLKHHQCLRIPVAFPLRLAVHVSSHPFPLGAATVVPDWRIRFACSDCLRAASRDVNASAVLFVPGSRCCRFGWNLGVHHRKISRRCSRVGIDLLASVLQTPRFSSIPNSISRFQRSSLFRFRMLRHVTTAALLLTMCSPVLVLKQSQQPSIQFTASFWCGPVLLCGLNKICSLNAAIC